MCCNYISKPLIYIKLYVHFVRRFYLASQNIFHNFALNILLIILIVESMNIKVKFLLELILEYISNCKNILNYRYNAGVYECDITPSQNTNDCLIFKISREREPQWEVYHIEVISGKTSCIMNLMSDEMSSEDRDLVTKVYKSLACQDPCGINSVLRKLLQ